MEELFGRRYVRRDQWKLVYNQTPIGNGQWQLYDLSRDAAESTDVAAAYPDIVDELRAEFAEYVERNDVVLPNNNLGPAL